jgi:rhamnosyltransferase
MSFSGDTFEKLPSVAVCLAAYNGAQYLPQQVKSILSQQSVEVTLFVSVDVSTDGTEAWALALTQKDPRVHLLPTGQKFGGAAANFFRLVRDIDFTHFDYVAFADQDDIWLPQKLQNAVKTLIGQCAHAYSSDVTAFWETGRSVYIKKSYPQRKWDYFFESAGPGCTFVLGRDLVVDMQCFLRDRPEKMAQVGLHDWFSYAFARSRGYCWVIDSNAYMLYRQHSNNQVGVNAGWQAFAWRVRQVLGGWGLGQARLIARLVASEEPWVKLTLFRPGRWPLLQLALMANQCRRRPRDRFLFACSCVMMALMGGNSNDK